MSEPELWVLEERRLVDGVWSEWAPLRHSCWSAPDDGYFNSINVSTDTIQRRVRCYAPTTRLVLGRVWRRAPA